MTQLTKEIQEVSTVRSEARKTRPVTGWAVLGSLCIAFSIYLYVAWIVSGDASRTPTGPTPVPSWMLLSIRSWEVVGVVGYLLAMYFVLVRPWRRERHITSDGLLVLGFHTLIWQDLIMNMFQPFYLYNSAFVNFGSWYRWMPGFLPQYPNRMVEATLWGHTLYIVGGFASVLLGCKIMARSRARWPELSNFGLVAIAAGFFAALSLFAEQIMLRSGLYTYPGAWSWATLWHGNYYQFPLYEPIIIAVAFSAWASFRYFKNDRGETFAERGIGSFPRRRSTTLVRFLAIAGVLNMTYFVFIQAPSAIIGIYSDDWPRDIRERSYFTNQLCGPGTEYACPGPRVPIRRPGSGHLDPNGKWVASGSP